MVLVVVAAVLLASAADQSERAGHDDRSRSVELLAVTNEPKRDPLAVRIEQELSQQVQPLLKKYCYECHGDGKKKGGVALDVKGDIQSIMGAADHWETVVEVMNARLMPPPDEPQPTARELRTIQQWVKQAADYYPPDAKQDPGWYTIHRLNRSEYRNTMRDLMGIDPDQHDLAAHLPADDSGYGFDNIADVLSMSPLQFGHFLDAAERAVDLTLGPAEPPKPRPLRKLERSNVGQELAEGGQVIWANGTISGMFDFKTEGTYELTIRARGDFAKGVGPKVAIAVDDDELDRVEVKARRRDQAQDIKLTYQATPGNKRISVKFLNDAVVEVDGKRQDRNLYVDTVTVMGPVRERNSAAYDAIFFVKPTADDKGNRLPDAQGPRRMTESQAAKQIIERFATRAFRRHVGPADTAGLMRVYRSAREQGESYESAMRLTITAALVSPNFLYRPIANPKPEDPEFVYELSDYELASRLSYFLWSSMPDDRLLALAKAKQLSQPRVLRAQVKRMLMDPRAQAFVENFAGQWLLLRKLDDLAMDPSKFPAFDAELRDSMRQEAERFFIDVVRENRPVTDFLDSDRTYLNERLARHYGINGVTGDDMRLVALPRDSPRGGVLTMAATLTVTSEATRTSPVKRGDYVLAQLMGTAPPPPPPEVPPFEQAAEQLPDTATLREQLAKHVEDPSCAVCHKRMDPIGLAMENFDAIGKWRDTEMGQPIDATGELPGGVRFDGPVELKQVMLDRKEQFVYNLSKTVLTYAVGRGTEPFDRNAIQQITQSCRDQGYRMQPMIEAVVLSDAFRKARGRKAQP